MTTPSGTGENPPAGGSPDPPKPTEPPKQDFTPITSQEDFDRRLAERLARERAKYADYADLRKKADAYDKAVDEARTEQEKAVAKAREEGKTEALSAANVKLAKAEARALAAEMKFKNPATAVRLLDLSDVKVSDNGDVDEDALRTKLKELASTESYLIDDGTKPPPKQDKSQGGSGGHEKPSVDRGKELFAARRKPTRSTTSA